MTKERAEDKWITRWRNEARALLLLVFVLLFGTVISVESTEYVKEGLKLAIERVIPSSFPFMIISDMYVCYGRPENIRLLSWTLPKLVGITPSGLPAIVCGNIGGFPIGAKIASDLYMSGSISKEEAERLLPMSNNPSCAFVMGGVGLGIYQDLRVGLTLLLCIYSATVIAGIITKNRYTHFDNQQYITGQKYSFIESVKGAGAASISIISFVSLFSVGLGIIKKRVKYAPISVIVFAFSEVTNAVNYFSKFAQNNPLLSVSLSAFSLGFGGMSVGMQSTVFTSKCGLNMRKYYSFKLLEGIIAAALCAIFFTIKNNCGAIG
ncbi:MAG: hypothetical protein IJW02_04935 [Clostridia bacterium]|nr:hypothetical protein [Clostridia bacterium]